VFLALVFLILAATVVVADDGLVETLVVITRTNISTDDFVIDYNYYQNIEDAELLAAQNNILAGQTKDKEPEPKEIGQTLDVGKIAEKIGIPKINKGTLNQSLINSNIKIVVEEEGIISEPMTKKTVLEAVPEPSGVYALLVGFTSLYALKRRRV
jgi:hypothetical protein